MFLCDPPVRRLALSFMLLTLYVQLSSNTVLSSGTNYYGITCFDVEREALLRFKAGVQCDNTTGHVIKLDLQGPHPFIIDGMGDPVMRNNSAGLGGKINPSLFSLKYLVHLDLSGNNFNYTPIPKFIGLLKELTYLNLSNACFGGTIPLSLGNLTKLQVLDLSSVPLENPLLKMHDAKWLFQLHALEDLDMSNVIFEKDASDQWVHALNSLPSIAKITLENCNLNQLPPTLHHVNFTSLSLFDLSDNKINCTIPSWLFKITSLQHLDLSWNFFHGHVPNSIGNMTSLRFLDLSANYDLHLNRDILLELKSLCKLQILNLEHMNIKHRFSDLGVIFSGCMKDSLEELRLNGNTLTGHLPGWIGNLTSLTFLDLSDNSFYGPLPLSFCQLSALQELRLGSNAFNGTVTEAHFHDFTRLEILDMSLNSLVFNLSADWVPQFQLKYILLRGISDTLPDWFWGITSNIFFLDLSNNEMKGRLPTSLESAYLEYFAPVMTQVFAAIDLSSNLLDGPIPKSIPKVGWLDLSNNSFTGSLPPKINEAMPKLYYINLSGNKINGTIPSKFCELQNLTALFLSENSLSGRIPDCWTQHSNLAILDFSFNHLSGHIPSSIFLPPALETLSLSNNHLSGHIHPSIRKCWKLYSLDLGYNMLRGNIPISLGESIRHLVILILASNHFNGNIPPQLFLLTALQVLDLSNNNLSGTIPKNIGNLTSMASGVGDGLATFDYSRYMFLTAKGLYLKYNALLTDMVLLDLSDNDLHGGIPYEIGKLISLHGLNLSGNHLTGEITDNIGSMNQLEFLDLSRNELLGAIPATLSKLNFLEILNLSYNHLSGEIPTGGQFNTFVDPSIYMDNDNLCGFALSKKCHDNNVSKKQRLKDEIDTDVNDPMWFCFGVMSGFVVGSWTESSGIAMPKNIKYLLRHLWGGFGGDGSDRDGDKVDKGAGKGLSDEGKRSFVQVVSLASSGDSRTSKRMAKRESKSRLPMEPQGGR
ncbi:receptor-like protein EIX2 [Dioscorea cayenensis subsp. rotundata]|uniref:Receptor-like protein EIX2 n=1 Tax=Dioscorea cayennensis subsp. rotundata TaxID=55577 RepID=A0AB40BWQ5_DIOCR|nr:receptor-like protein EIX2 [Dioscorea cayenensis subsp. rotundata]